MCVVSEMAGRGEEIISPLDERESSKVFDGV